MSRLSKYCIVLGVCCTEEKQSHRFVQMLRGVNDDRTLIVGLCSFFSSFRDDAFIILIEFLHQCSLFLIDHAFVVMYHKPLKRSQV